jgi:hypothetical protein
MRRLHDACVGDPMSIGARCGSCNRELLLVHLVQPSQGFRRLFCASPSPAYATGCPSRGCRGPCALVGPRRCHAALATSPHE